MAITRVRVKLNGVWVNLTQNASTGKWTGTLTAPSATSFNLSGGYYPLEVEASNDAGTVATKSAVDAALGEFLRLVVRETIKPVIVLKSPSGGAYVGNNKPPIMFEVTDQAGGSGVKLSSVSLKVDSAAYGSSASGMTYEGITNGYRFTFVPPAALNDGGHTIIIDAQDNDGNAAGRVTSSFKVDTVPPTLNISAPAAGLITNNKDLTVEGSTNDAISSPVTVKITLNGTDQGNVAVRDNGSFSKPLVLTEGTNTIVTTATDSAGKSSSVTRSVKLDTSIPEIKSVKASPNPADIGGSITITVEVL